MGCCFVFYFSYSFALQERKNTSADDVETQRNGSMFHGLAVAI